MPGSFGIFDDAVAALVSAIAPTSVLDIGTGSGKYGELVKSRAPHVALHGIEVEASYVERYKLRELYPNLRVMNAMNLLNVGHDEKYDLVIIGDCIEHMRKSDGLDLLNFLTYRCQYTVVLAPEFCVQGSVNGIGSESHISVWSEHDFAWHDAWAFDNAQTIGLYLLRGYLPGPSTLEGVVNSVNAAKPPVMDFARERVIRATHLALHARHRFEQLNGQTVSFRAF